jgi:peptide/nickel transport system ATP-binding protein
VEVVGLTKRYGDVTALDDVSLRIGHGEVVGLVGESGSGKTTLGRAIVGLTRPDAGAVLLGGAPMPSELRHRTPEVRRSLQMVFQSPHDTLNPRQRVRQVLARAARKLRGRSSVEQLAASCRLDPSLLDQLASTLSGGQKQRVAIARAIAGDAPLIVCDEPVSSLDVSVQAAILDLLVELQREHGVSLLFVSHDLAVVGYVAERVAVMYAGRIVEEGPTAAVLRPPHHPYTAELVSARQASSIDAPHTPCAPDEVSWSGRDWATGCAFVGRCPSAIPGTCDVESPPVRLLADDRSIRCHLDLESPSREQALGASMSRS